MKISVLMSVYFGEKPEYLALSLQSLADQTVPANETVLVEDGPLGYELEAVIEQYKNKLNIKSIRLEQNKGLAVALNRGLKICSHELVARMDSDDICLPGRFERQASCFEKDPELDVLGTFAQDIDEKGNPGLMRKKPIAHADIVSSLWTNPFIHSTVMFKKNRVRQAGGYDESLKRRQDYELWFRLAKQNLKFSNIPEILSLYRFSPETHRKQPVRLAWQQSRIGYKGACMMEMSWWKKVACFEPFLRSFLPGRLQHIVYTWLRKMDPVHKQSIAAK